MDGWRVNKWLLSAVQTLSLRESVSIRDAAALESPLTRGFAALPVKTAEEGAAARKKQAEYYATITEKFPRYARGRFSEEALNRALAFLTDRGISKTNAMGAIARFPKLVESQRETLESKIAWLEELGLSHDKINVTILRNPSMLANSIEKYVAMVDWYLAHGVPKSKLPFLFNVSPGLLILSLDNLDSKVDFFRESGFTDEQITRILKLAPHILSKTAENLNSKLDYMVQLGVPRERLLELVPNAPHTLGLATTRIQETIDALDEMLGDGAGVQALVRSLRVLMYNVEGLRRSFNYLVSVVGLTPERLSTSSTYICRSRDDILRPRFEFLKTQGVETVATLTWITRSHREFVEKYPGYEAYVVEYKARQKKTTASAL
ncbi:hypothetical protein PF008_g6640 [Phytophthora fragariae]|uniref:Uncharacterized protein n=1 Tax=Phytophthora fragariae TaxID=53985 RepID=A0A6G0S6M5_9STRA|nr:hypothetical protein PF008_g6640 [Phytophthora fragariae]